MAHIRILKNLNTERCLGRNVSWTHVDRPLYATTALCLFSGNGLSGQVHSAPVPIVHINNSLDEVCEGKRAKGESKNSMWTCGARRIKL